MKKTSLLSLEAYVSDETSSSDDEAAEQRNQTDSLSNNLAELKKPCDTTSSLTPSSKETTEAGFELEQTYSLSSCPDKVIKDSDKSLPNLKEPTEKSRLSDLKKTNLLSNSPAKVKKRVGACSFSFSLISYLMEPAEASNLTDYELDQTESLFSCPTGKEKKSDNLLPIFKELSEACHLSVSELKQTNSLSSPTEVKEDTNNNNLVFNPKETTEASHVSEPELGTTEVKRDSDDCYVTNPKETIEVICLSDSELEKDNSSSNSSTAVKNQRDTNSFSFSLTPFFKEASFLSDIEPNKINGEQAQELDENSTESNLNIYGESSQSSSQKTSVTTRRKKHKEKKSKNKDKEKKYPEKSSEVASFSKSSLKKDKRSLVSNEYSTVSDCDNSPEEGLCSTDDDFDCSLQAAKVSCFEEFSEVFNIPVPSIPLPASKDFSTPSSLKRSHSNVIKDDFTIPSSKRSYSKTDSSTPTSKRSYSMTKEDFSTPTSSSKRSHSVTKEDFSTPTTSSKRKYSMIEDDSVDDNAAVFQKSTDLPKLFNVPLVSIPPPPPPEETFDSFSFFKKYPPPSLKRSHSMTEDDTVDGNRFVSQNPTHHHNNFAAFNSPINRARKSFPDKRNTSFSQPFIETPKRTYDDNSRRRSFPGKFSHQSTYRSCATDQTPYSPYQSHKRLRTELPYYNVSNLMTFQSDDGFIDSHCHLDFLFQRLYYKGSYKDFQEENKDTFPQCYKGCLAIFCNPNSFKLKHFWQDYLEEENVWASFGCHPHNAREYNHEVEESLLTALEHPKVRALGEIGLDYSIRNNCPKDIQKEAFRRQLKIALNKKLPLVIHCRDAHEDGIYIMKEMVPKNYFIHLHCFTDTWEVASHWLQEFPNLYIGITNVVTFPSASDVHEVAKKIPLTRLLLETDSPYFVPKPLSRDNHNSRFSHPGMAIHVAAQIAALKGGIPLELILNKTRHNTKTIYKI